MNKKWKIAAALLVVLFVTGAAVGTTLLKGKPFKWKSHKEIEREKVTAETLEYMKKSYNEEFEIESVKYIPQNKSYAIMLHPKTDPDLKIRVLKWAMGGYELTDDYIPEKRFRQTTKYFKHFANDISNKNLFHANFHDQVRKGEMYWNMKYSIEDLIKNESKKTRIVVAMFFFFDITEENVDEVCKKLYKMVKYMQDADIGEVEMEVLFFSEEYFAGKDVEKINREEMGPAGMMNFQSIYGDYALTRVSIFNKMVRYKDIKNYRDIKSYKDIKRIMHYIVFLEEREDGTHRRKSKWINK